MHSAILRVELPPDSHPAHEGWSDFQAAIATVKDNPAATQLAENVWQVDFQRSPAALAELVVACERHQYAYQILALDAEPQWIRVTPEPGPS